MAGMPARPRWTTASAAGSAETWENAATLAPQWATSPKGALAALILTDQFPRNMFRDDPRAFATDPAGASDRRPRHCRGLRPPDRTARAPILLLALRTFRGPCRPAPLRRAFPATCPARMSGHAELPRHYRLFRAFSPAQRRAWTRAYAGGNPRDAGRRLCCAGRGKAVAC